MTYELFDTQTGNIIGAYETEEQALIVLKSAIQAYGASYADHIVFGVRDSAGYPRAIAEGQELTKLALQLHGVA